MYIVHVYVILCTSSSSSKTLFKEGDCTCYQLTLVVVQVLPKTQLINWLEWF